MEDIILILFLNQHSDYVSTLKTFLSMPFNTNIIYGILFKVKPAQSHAMSNINGMPETTDTVSGVHVKIQM